ncbi:MAG TPA: tRNA (adenosine(37)-N6)-threonylcarbamoyltransferase complex ATPase subunit type 1 TsaE [Dissulfurispiraceae bacterium]|nr:tRNA (adenosine(37)-N6)-threonylcarbamoyltransferase complex ATPase subunit type 1 TsaE [Dissulfurispiraceae bacterium]
MDNDRRVTVTNSAEETEEFGFKLGTFLKKGKAVTVCLYGELGAGKTTFVKGFAAAFGIPGREIGSASFVIVAEYETVPPFYHIDLYRLGDEPCLEDIGLWEYIGSGGIAVVEWAEKLGEMPEGAVSVNFEYLGEDRRQVLFTGIDGTDWDRFLQETRKK